MSPEPGKKIGLLGGTFDPVHLGHLDLARDLLSIGLDEVWLVPAYDPPHKRDSGRTSAEHRLAMLRLATAEDSRLGVCEVELERRGKSYTIDTLKQLGTAYPGAEFYLAMGMDMFLEFDTWRDWWEILQRAHIVVAERPGVATAPRAEILRRLFGNIAPYAPASDDGVFVRTGCAFTIRFFQPRQRDISSSEIRRRASENIPVKNLLPPQVEEYMITHHLYQSQFRPFKDE